MSDEVAVANSSNGEADLMTGMARDWPLLSEAIGPVFAIPKAREAADVLNNSSLLIVGFLEQKAVVLNVRLGRGSLCERRGLQGQTYDRNVSPDSCTG